MILNLPSQDQISSLPSDGGPDYNRLIFEKSPYLLQHAANPVDWYPWGEEAFQQARIQDKPIFLSIGYATCHWCHVMEEESFQNREAAGLINDFFIPIKVDREERPDVDGIYMAVCQAITGAGGWPLTALLTPENKPFFIGTYFPRESRMGRTGLLDLLSRAADLWANSREELLQSAEGITSQLQEGSQTAKGKLDPAVVERAFRQLDTSFDPAHGGFGRAPKFPTPHHLIFLLRYWRESGEDRALQMVERTLQAMRLGGIYDHVGFGFHRYATDASWRLPHFEKMLYDQAMLTMAYCEAFQATGKQVYGETAREILTYVLRDLTDPGGGFYSAEDADSEGKEGLFYLWSREEFQRIARERSRADLADLFNLQPEGNFLEEATGQPTGLNLLYLERPLRESGEETGQDPEELADSWEDMRQALFEIREERVHPLKDDKILTGWNGLMVAALAAAGTALAEPEYSEAAQRAADFIWNEMRKPDGRLYKRFRDGEAGLTAHLDDYAYLAWGFLELHQANFQGENLRRALELTEIALARFWDEEQGGFYFTQGEQQDLILRRKDLYDGAVPSGNSVAFHNLIRLARLLSRPDLEEKALAIGEAFSHQINQFPQGYTQFLSGLQGAASAAQEIVIAGDPEGKDTQEMLRVLRKCYLPNSVVLLRPSPGDEELFALVPVLREQIPLEGRATAYVCSGFHCSAPTTDPAEMLALLEK